ncbi:L-type lectin-domain containing receptor kinase IV.2-like [Durio zibethinus]|uniref:non-specific serine/threonine protein kinase n=1 Tax=Durio zibethinus TaxID=66656 RepID=A0A6P5ZVT6_DURZI|nr:L-type lectin-domain containing receptor kinase IV.2-like [Durio zibethinus]
MARMSRLLRILVAMAAVCSIAFAEGQNQFIYNGFHGVDLNLSGIAKVQNGLLELTNISYQQFGRAFFPLPIKFNSSDSLSFSTSFVFAMVPEFPKLGGHGLAFIISPSPEFVGAVASQYFGLFNATSNGLSTNHVFAIELDSIKSPEFGDIDDNHVGIDVNNLRSNASAPASYYSDKEGENKTLELISGKPIQLWIDYDEGDMLLQVRLAPLKTKKPSQPLLSARLDLSEVFLESMYVGFSASTGAMASNQYILGWSFNKSGQAQGLDYSKIPSPPHPRESGKKLDFRIMVPLVIMSLLVIIVIGAAYNTWRKKYEEIREDWEQEYGPQRFSYRDLYKATKGFKERELLGVGGFGGVYKGILPSSKEEVAVKRISHNSKQGMKEFVAEIASMGRLSHRNVVQLLGYCRRKGELLLVYDFMPNGSLEKFLFTNEKLNLNWAQRVQILKGVASALLYLHEEWDQVVIHRDIKASNILLDAHLNGRLGDFGLAKFYDHGTNPQTTLVVGTLGYIAPELARTGKSTTSSDVFAFGNLMLEIACGRKSLEPERLPEEIILVDWVLECWKTGMILQTSDPRLEGNYVETEMELILKLGLLCAHPTPATRPSMRKVVQYLDGNATLPEVLLDDASNSLVTDTHQISVNDMSFPASFDNISTFSMSSVTDSILSYGH